jgi:hypothetical protein
MAMKEVLSMSVTATEPKADIGGFLDRTKIEDIDRFSDRLALLESLVGVAEGTSITLEEARSERLAYE